MRFHFAEAMTDIDYYIPLAKAAEANGFCEPFSFDITAAAKSNGDNLISIVGTRTFLNELGTGGLLGPTLIYREK